MLTSIDDIEIVGERQLGEGAFSRVVKCRRRADGRLYALKIVGLTGGFGETL